MIDEPAAVPCASCGETVAFPRAAYKMRGSDWTVIHPVCFDRTLAEDPSFQELKIFPEPVPLWLYDESFDDDATA